MKVTLDGQDVIIPDHVIRGIYKICKLPMTTGEVFDYLSRIVEERILFSLVNWDSDVHESCYEDSRAVQQD